jgi:hypothetical protein
VKIRGGGSSVALALAALAVVLAATGTAYAVTTTRVNLVDPVHPRHQARVDSHGSLSVSVKNSVPVSTPTSRIDVTSLIAFDTTSAITSPTTATLAINTLSYSNPRLNSNYTGTDYDVSLVQIRAGAGGHCVDGTDGAFVERSLAEVSLSPGDDINTSFPAPLIVRAIASQKYCLGLRYFHIGGSQSILYESDMQLTGYAVQGSYTGIGVATKAVAAARTAPKLLRR